MRKRDFQRLFTKYGANSIASVLGVTASTVRKWRTKGTPKNRETVLKTLEVVRRHEGYEEKALREMMALARKSGELKTPKNYNKRRNGERTTGYESSQKFSGFLNEGLLLQIRQHLESVPLARALPNWLASVEMSVLGGSDSIYVAAPVRFQVEHPEADDFIVSGIESSGLQHSRRAAIDSVIGKLRNKLQSDARFYVHGASFSTYEYKNEEDVKELRRTKRKSRAVGKAF